MANFLGVPRVGPRVVDIWSKASVGDYLWSHILKGPHPLSEGPLVQTAQLTYKDILFSFRAGPGLVPSTAPKNVSRLVMVLNGRSQDKVLINNIF